MSGTNPKIFVIAGERSGDLHAGEVIQQIKTLAPEAEIVGYGGDYMEKAGAQILSHYREGAFMGLWEVITNIRKINSRMDQCKKAIDAHNPDVVLLVDYPGFNLRMARYAHNKGIHVAYYIAPKIWAWNQKRIRKIKASVDEMYAILPFEVDFFQSLEYPVRYVGNPLVEQIARHEFLDPGKKKGINIAFLPGSRVHEVKASLQMIALLAAKRPEFHFWVAGVNNLPMSLYDEIAPLPNVSLEIGKTYDLLRIADAAIVTSGTATLETLLLDCPQVVCYRTSSLTYHVGKWVIRVPYISLVNLIGGKEIVRELIQQAYNPDNVLHEIDRLLNDVAYRSKMKSDYEFVREKLGDHKTAAEVAAHILGSGGA